MPRAHLETEMQNTILQFHQLLDTTHALLDQFLTQFTRLEKQVELQADLLDELRHSPLAEHPALARRAASPHKGGSHVPTVASPQTPCLNVLRGWVGYETCRVLYDTERDGWEIPRFRAAVAGKKNVVLAVTTEKGDVFGAYVAKTVRPNWTLDKQFFVFSMRSQGRAAGPRRWFAKRTTRNPNHALYLASTLLFQVGPYNDGYFSVGGPTSKFNTNNRLSTRFDGIHDADLTGIENDSQDFVVFRVVAFCFE